MIVLGKQLIPENVYAGSNHRLTVLAIRLNYTLLPGCKLSLDEEDLAPVSVRSLQHLIIKDSLCINLYGSCSEDFIFSSKDISNFLHNNRWNRTPLYSIVRVEAVVYVLSLIHLLTKVEKSL